MTLRAGWVRAIGVACAGVLVGFVIWSVAGEAIRTGGLGVEALDDYAIARALSRAIVERADYAWQLTTDGPGVLYVYAPPYALLHVGLAATGPVAGPLLFMLLVVVACAGGARAGLGLLGAGRSPLRWLMVLLAVASCRVFVQADLHLLNANALAVALAVGALAALGPASGSWPREAAGGLLLAASLAVKPFALGLAPIGLVLRRWSAAAWALAFGLAIFLGLPLVVLGAAATLSLTTSWIEVLGATLGSAGGGRAQVDDVSLRAAARALDLAGPAFWLVARGLPLLFGAAAVGLLVPSLRAASRGTQRLDGRAWMRIGATALVAPVPLSAIFQPHHAVAAVPLALVVAHDALAPGLSQRGRALRLAGLATVFGLSTYGPGGAARGPVYLACLALLVLAAWCPTPPRRG